MRISKKRVLSLLMVLVLVLTLLPASALAAGNKHKITVHFANSRNWGSVSLYAWNAGGDRLLGDWPGTAIAPAEDGFYSHSFEVPTGEQVNIIFSGGNEQTVDLALGTVQADVEKWVRITGQTDGKYTADLADQAFPIITSPVVHKDGSVTFRYYDPQATSVSLRGSMNGWGGTAMTKDSQGIWSLTLKDLAVGTYEYKFFLNGKDWIRDPANSSVVGDNSAFLITDATAKDQNKITLNIHYSRPDQNYSGWNFWIWNNTGNIANNSKVINGELVQTVVFSNARAILELNVIPRRSTSDNQWAAQEGSFRIDLSSVVSGTVDYYITAGNGNGQQKTGTDVVQGIKLSAVTMDYDNNAVRITTAKPVTDAVFELKKDGTAVKVAAKAVAGGYTLTPSHTVDLAELYRYKVIFEGYEYAIDGTAAYAGDRFAKDYTYTGSDLGATWTKKATTFRLWAPTATKVEVVLYTTGSNAEAGAGTLGAHAMKRDKKGTWVLELAGDHHGVYYTYRVTRDGKTVETVDPYARTTGVNGRRGMVLDLASTNPAGWGKDQNPNPSTSYTDAVIYELHIRDFSMDSSSGILEDYRGKFLALTQTGTTVNGKGSISTGIDYLKSLGITHLHLLPVYDYASVDERTNNGYNWGYDPQNYNTPEGSYATDPYKGEVRVAEFKQMVKALHDAGISVVMDVVYNHVYDAGTYCFNQIVPGYFSRQNSNGSGCGNDTASEREMVRKFIVDSVLYWTKEYHIDGFRFDLVGLLDVTTINTLVNEVHKIRPDVLFYGEGWTLGTNVEPGNAMATQQNSAQTPLFAYFSDTIRNLLAGSNGGSKGFVSGEPGKETDLVYSFLAQPGWSNNPSQVIQYASCHDNYTLMDKLIISTGASGITDRLIRMNNLTAAIYMTAQGIPFIHAGEEMLREKLLPGGKRDENSYRSPDSVNAIKWSKLSQAQYADTSAYYKGLIAFRKAHPVLRLNNAAEVGKYVRSGIPGNNVITFFFDGSGLGDDDIFVIFNANDSAVDVTLPWGNWKVCVNATDAGTKALATVKNQVKVDGVSAMILTRSENAAAGETITLYFSNNKFWNDVYAYAWDANGNVLGDWPGRKMTFVQTNDYGEDIYSVTLPATVTGIIFTNGTDRQTVDLIPGVDGTGYYCGALMGEKWAGGNYVYREPADMETVEPTIPAPTDPIQPDPTEPSEPVTPDPTEPETPTKPEETEPAPTVPEVPTDPTVPAGTIPEATEPDVADAVDGNDALWLWLLLIPAAGVAAWLLLKKKKP